MKGAAIQQECDQGKNDRDPRVGEESYWWINLLRADVFEEQVNADQPKRRRLPFESHPNCAGM
jgi:hypothetical protein